MPDPNTPATAQVEHPVAAYLELYKQQMERFHQTREVEWKANISLWTLLAGAVYLAKDHSLGIARCVAYFAVLLIVALHGWWLFKVHASEHVDKILWTRYRSDALLLLRGRLLKHEGEVAERKWAPSWLALEIGMTAILALVLAYLATRK
jgi:hypothetical protein